MHVKQIKQLESQRPFASTSQPPKKVSLNDGRQVYWLARLPSAGLPAAGLQWLFGGCRRSQLRGQLRLFTGFPFKPQSVPSHR